MRETRMAKGNANKGHKSCLASKRPNPLSSVFSLPALIISLYLNDRNPTLAHWAGRQDHHCCSFKVTKK
jgi:hypothetical protein